MPLVELPAAPPAGAPNKLPAGFWPNAPVPEPCDPPNEKPPVLDWFPKSEGAVPDAWLDDVPPNEKDGFMGGNQACWFT